MAVVITIDETGETTFEVQGVRGSGCKALTEALEKSVGSTVSDKNTAEYFQAPQSLGQKASAGQ